MAYKSVFVCEECKIEAPPLYPAATNDYPSSPQPPVGWWALTRGFTPALVFCTKDCLANWLGEGG